MPRRHSWIELPLSVREQIQLHTDLVLWTRAPGFGKSSEFSATLHAAGGTVFCKGVRVDRAHAWTHRNEAAVAPFLPAALAPQLLWEVAKDGWLMLVFEYVPGRHPSLSPTSAHLDLIGDLVVTMAEALTPCPAAARHSLAERWGTVPGWAAVHAASPADLDPWAREHLDVLATLERGAWLDGDTLVHSDLHQGNMLAEDGRVRVIDWARSARGAAWIDTAHLVVRLIHEGHTPETAEAWAIHVPAFARAPEPVITAFAAKLAGMWEYIARSPRARPHARALADTARRWARHRLG
ncbi:hypothetical protein [Embleya sp. NPDC059237]|uniref:hypothetical protein n=1 Tax=Embleya sp. NPDC059237 TaxID=3346784 RepID=UPI00369E33AA